MKNVKNKIKSMKGLTLLALVVTIIVLIILAGITLNLLMGENGIITKTKQAKDENEKATAKETMTLKITECQMRAYSENGKLPDLQYIADRFCEDNDIAYVNLEKQKVGAINDKITIGENTSIFTKLEKYPYEFEINSSLQLASIDGVKVASNVTPSTEYVKKSDYDALLARVVALENNSSSQSSGSTASNNYSIDDEQVVGTWIDNKTIYQKTFTTTTTIPSSSSWVNITIPDSNIETLIDIELSAHSGDIMLTTAKADVIMLNGTTVQIQQRQSSGLTFTIDGITLRYTKKPNPTASE